MPWKTFLQAHWEGLAACDLFTVEVLTLAGLRRYLVFFVIELRSRRVTIAGIHPQPGGAWMEQQARNVTRPGRWLFAQGAPSDSRPRSPLYAGLWRDPGERRCSADSAAAEESQSQRLCRAVRQVDQRGVSHTRGPARRGASASSRLRVHRTRPSREKPPGTRQPAPATTTTSAKAGRRRSAAGTPRRITQFLQSRGRMRGRPIKRTLRRGLVAQCLPRPNSEYSPRCLGTLPGSGNSPAARRTQLQLRARVSCRSCRSGLLATNSDPGSNALAGIVAWRVVSHRAARAFRVSQAPSHALTVAPRRGSQTSPGARDSPSRTVRPGRGTTHVRCSLVRWAGSPSACGLSSSS